MSDKVLPISRARRALAWPCPGCARSAQRGRGVAVSEHDGRLLVHCVEHQHLVLDAPISVLRVASSTRSTISNENTDERR